MMIIKYDYCCNQCGKVEAGLVKEPAGWLHGSLTPYPTNIKDDLRTNQDVHICSWECASQFARVSFEYNEGLRGMSLALSCLVFADDTPSTFTNVDP